MNRLIAPSLSAYTSFLPILPFLLPPPSAMMPLFFISCLAVVALGPPGANAGSRAWESNIKSARAVHQDTIQARDLALESYGNASDVIASRSPGTLDSALPNAEYHYHNGSSQSVHKRWFGIGTDDTARRLWPQGNIKVCFEQAIWQKVVNGRTETLSTEQILREPLNEARGLWRDKGLDDDNGWFKWDVQADKSYCSDRNHRPDFLLVMYAGPDVATMVTSVSMGQALSPGVPSNSFEKLGPTMLLSDNEVMGHRNPVANFAHEMGHAWGLYHEHQNRAWWSEDILKDAEQKDTWFFGEGSWFCQRLKGYAEAAKRVRDDPNVEGWEKEKVIEKLCRVREVAAHYDFFYAAEFLPITSSTQWEAKKQPDWTSIMIYHSHMGIENADDTKNTAVLLTKPAGDIIRPVTKPSSLDVHGLRTMYNAPTKAKLKLLNNVSSGASSAFKKVFGKTSDSGC